MTTARNRAIDRVRRDARYKDKLAMLASLPDTASREPDDRLRLIFTCCHPALDADAQVALTLRAVAGLTTAEIARAFVVPESTLAKRLTRAKQKIVAAGIPYRTPEPEEWPSRLDQVLRVIYLVFNEAYLTTEGDAVARLELAHDAGWLTTLLVGWLPEEPEALGLQALVQLHLARWSARVDPNGHIVLFKTRTAQRGISAKLGPPPPSSSRPDGFDGLGPTKSKRRSRLCTVRRQHGTPRTGPNSFSCTRYSGHTTGRPLSA